MAPIVTWQAPVKSGVRTEDDDIRAAYNLPPTVEINDAMRTSFRSGASAPTSSVIGSNTMSSPQLQYEMAMRQPGALTDLAQRGEAAGVGPSSMTPQQLYEREMRVNPNFGADQAARGTAERGTTTYRGVTTPPPQTTPPQQTTTGNQITVDPMLTATYNQNLQNFLTGSAYDPYAQSAAEGNARAARNLRAGTASQIGRLGLAGQGVADQLAGATTQQIMGQTLDTNLGIAKGRTEMQQDAMGEFRSNRGEIWNENRAIRNEGRTDAERAFDWAIEYGSDDDVIRAAAQRGVTLDPASVATYRNEQRMARQTAVTSGLETDFAGYAMAHPDQDWRGDQGATAKGAALYKAYTGKDADVNSPEFAEFMDRQWGAAQYEENPVDATVSGIKTSDWYKGLPKDRMSAPPGYTGMTQDDVDVLTSMTLFNGYTVAHNADGTVSIVDPTGKAVTNPSSYKPSGQQTVDFATTGTANVVIPQLPTIKNAQSVVDELSDGGVDTDADRVLQYQAEKGKWPDSPEDFRAWDNATYNSTRITNAFSADGGGDTSEFTPADWEAFNAVSRYETALAKWNKANDIVTGKTPAPGTGLFAGATSAAIMAQAQAVVGAGKPQLDPKYVPLVGKIQTSNLTLPASGINQTNASSESPGSVMFSNTTKSAIDALSGKPVLINGETYIFDPEDPTKNDEYGDYISATNSIGRPVKIRLSNSYLDAKREYDLYQIANAGRTGPQNPARSPGPGNPDPSVQNIVYTVTEGY